MAWQWAHSRAQAGTPLDPCRCVGAPAAPYPQWQQMQTTTPAVCRSCSSPHRSHTHPHTRIPTRHTSSAASRPDGPVRELRRPLSRERAERHPRHPARDPRSEAARTEPPPQGAPEDGKNAVPCVGVWFAGRRRGGGCVWRQRTLRPPLAAGSGRCAQWGSVRRRPLNHPHSPARTRPQPPPALTEAREMQEAGSAGFSSAAYSKHPPRWALRLCSARPGAAHSQGAPYLGPADPRGSLRSTAAAAAPPDAGAAAATEGWEGCEFSMGLSGARCP